MASSGSQQIDQLIVTMANDKNNPAVRQKALTTLNSLLRSSPNYMEMIQTGLRDYGYHVRNGVISHGQTPVDFSGQAGGMAQNMWGSALQDMQTVNPNPNAVSFRTKKQDVGRGEVVNRNPAQELEVDRNSGNVPPPLNDGQVQAGGATYDPLNPSAQPDASAISTTNPEYANSFFGNAQAGALNELVGNPNSAFQYYRARGGPGGRSLANSTASIYGQDDFMSAMALAPLLAGDAGSGIGLAPAQTLGFTDQFMKGATQGGGTYADPSKILSGALASAARAPDAQTQQGIIQTALKAVEPFMDPASYSMMMGRVNNVMDQYMAYGLENGTADLSGVLVDQIYQALGM